MTTEWKDLLTLQDISHAKTNKWEIEQYTGNGLWSKWSGQYWLFDIQYRGRPRQPKMKKIKILAWIDSRGEFRLIKEGTNAFSNWIHVPSEDKTVEVPE